jgi:hypothetical protein
MAPVVSMVAPSATAAASAMRVIVNRMKASLLSRYCLPLLAAFLRLAGL